MRRRSLLGGLLALSLPTVALAGPTPTIRQSFVVAIDPGHGGTNHGCHCADGTHDEKDLTLVLALELRAAILEKIPHAQVVMTREDDRSLTLAQRVATANTAQADVFISLHANASNSRSQHGFETYVLDAQASSLEAARTARRENDAELAEPSSTDANPEVATMVRQLEMAQHRRAAVGLARAIQSEQAQRFPQRLDRGVRQASFDVLMGARMPAVLFEAGFLDHATEHAMLTDQATRDTVVKGLVEAFVHFYRQRSRVAA